MIYYDIRGYGYSKRLCENVLAWFIKEHMPRHKLDIDIKHCGLKRDDSFGYCDVKDSFTRPREFEISLKAHMDKENYIKTLLHELVHVHQWVTGILKMRKKRMYYADCDISEYSYDDQPHEIDARKKEISLYKKYMKIPEHDRQFTNRLCGGAYSYW